MAGYQFPGHDGLQHLTPSAGLEVVYQPQPPVSADWQRREIEHQTESTPDRSPQTKRIAGLRKFTFWLVLALAVVTIVAVVGGGVGGSLAVKSASHSSCPFPTTANQSAHTNPSALTNATQALTNLSVPAPSTVVSVALDCPAIDGKSYTSGTGSNFKQKCNHNLQGGSPALGNNGLINGTISNIIGIVAYSFTDCIEACSTMNRFGYGPQCHGVSFDLRMEHAYEVQQCNCWLKNATGEGKESDTEAIATLVVT